MRRRTTGRRELRKPLWRWETRRRLRENASPARWHGAPHAAYVADGNRTLGATAQFRCVAGSLRVVGRMRDPDRSRKEPSAQEVLASERTLLAWLRTAVSLMAFGFVIARFDWFVHRSASRGGSILGASLAAGGGLFAAFAALRHWRERHSSQPVLPGPALAVAAGAVVALAALAVTGFLLVHRLEL